MQQPDVDELKRTLVRNAMFVPIFDIDGEEVFTYDDYKNARHENNYDAVEPRPIDRTVRQPNSQSGSNEGAVYVFPGGSRNYVKFSNGENDGHLWSEVLADSLYREVQPELVPNTEAVFIEGRMARSSQLVPLDTEALVTDEARNQGFVMDCLLGNWDAVYNPQNLVMSGGRAMRIDTGNTLNFRARGGRKEEGAFGPVVTELNFGTDRQRLGDGMRQMYPGLSDSQIEQQARQIKNRLTDEVIDRLVNSVVLPSEERASLSETLKQRRDYIAGWTSDLAKSA